MRKDLLQSFEKAYAEAKAKKKAALTPEQKAAHDKAEAAKAEEARKKFTEKATKDTKLLTTEAEVKKAGDLAEIRRLASLDGLEYAQTCKGVAGDLGITVAVLDKLVAAERRLVAGANQHLQGQEMTLREIEPWPDPVDGADVLNRIVKVLSRYVIMPEEAADVVALWCAHTHVYEEFKCTPRLNISSPETDCGKTTLNKMVSSFVPRPLLAEVLTEATIFRTVEKYRPTILADEINNWLDGRPEVLAVLNAGHGRDVMIPRCVGEDHEPRIFNVFAPATLCGIGPLPDQLHSRSIVIHLEKARPGEIKGEYDEDDAGKETEELGRKLARFCADNKTTFKEFKAVMPPGIGNRLKDNWRPLFKIAQVTGGDWPQRVNAAFTKLTARTGSDVESTGTRLLSDIREIFESHPIVTPLFPSGDLVRQLNEMEDRGWKDYGHLQKGITTHQLSLELLPYKIKPQKVRHGRDTLRGYRVSDFKEIFERYLPPPAAPELPFES